MTELDENREQEQDGASNRVVAHQVARQQGSPYSIDGQPGQHVLMKAGLLHTECMKGLMEYF